MTATATDRVRWTGSSDKDGHRTYNITWLVETDTVDDGPNQIANAAGLPVTGTPWAFGNDSDPWAFCWPTLTARATRRDPGGSLQWHVTQTYTTKPLSRCQDTSIEDPLNEPAKISGSFVKYLEEAYLDRNGKSISSSSFELFRGAAVEFDNNRPTVRIQQNYATQQLDVFSPMVDTVNDALLWGLDPRKIKLSNCPWQRQLYGTCSYYYTVTYEFDINFQTFDRKLVDEGLMLVNPDIQDPEANDPATGQPWYKDPKNFVRAKDDNDEASSTVLLNGKGSPLKEGEVPFEIDFEKYEESNFLLLGIPTSL